MGNGGTRKGAGEGGEIKGCRPPNQIGPGGWAPLQHLNAHLDIPAGL